MDNHEQRLRAIAESLEADRIRNLIGPAYGGGSSIKVPREPASTGIGSAKSGRESNPPAPASHIRSERPAPLPREPTTAAERLWPNLPRR